jgi:hypothetical protein
MTLFARERNYGESVTPICFASSNESDTQKTKARPVMKPVGLWLEIEIAAGAASAGHKPLDFVCRTVAH